MATWLLIDANNLAYQMAFSGRGSSLEDMDVDDLKANLIVQVLEAYLYRRRSLNASRVVWCFDGNATKSIRAQVLAGYKKTRKEKEKLLSPKGAAAVGEIRYQMLRLRKGALPAAGFRNVLCSDGYEADDHVAAAAATIQHRFPGDEVLILSTDKDLYQCLTSRVSVIRPTGVYTVDDFKKEYRIDPPQWKMVKAIAGCPTDDVPGVDGVAEKTALKFVRKELPPHHKTYQRITAASPDWIPRNMKLVRLPMDGTPEFTYGPDQVTAERWAAVCRKLQAIHLIRQAPLSKG